MKHLSTNEPCSNEMSSAKHVACTFSGDSASTFLLKLPQPLFDFIASGKVINISCIEIPENIATIRPFIKLGTEPETKNMEQALATERTYGQVQKPLLFGPFSEGEHSSFSSIAGGCKTENGSG